MFQAVEQNSLPQTSRPVAVFASFSGHGGVERMLINLLRGFVDLGQEIDLVLVRDTSPHLARLPDRVNLIRLGTPHTLFAAPALARYLRERRPLAILAAKDRGGRAAVLARALSGTRTPILMRLGTHLSTAMTDRTAIERWLRYAPIRLLYPQIERIIAVSNGVADDTARIARIPRHSISVIRNPVITPELETQAAESCPHRWFAPGQPPVILGVGRLQRQKDFATLIRAFAQLRQRVNARLVILGEGSGRRALMALIAELALEDCVDLPGFQRNPYPFLAHARLFALSSAWEGSPNVLTEAMALGIPVVSTDCLSGPSEILDDGRYGRLVPVGDASALAAAMHATLAQPLASAVLREAVTEYEQRRSAECYLQEIRSVCG